MCPSLFTPFLVSLRKGAGKGYQVGIQEKGWIQGQYQKKGYDKQKNTKKNNN
jgi:hypothetical protein